MILQPLLARGDASSQCPTGNDTATPGVHVNVDFGGNCSSDDCQDNKKQITQVYNINTPMQQECKGAFSISNIVLNVLFHNTFQPHARQINGAFGVPGVSVPTPVEMGLGTEVETATLRATTW